MQENRSIRFCLSSKALPDASLDELRRAARRHALAGLELVLEAGHRHGLDEMLRPFSLPSSAVFLQQEEPCIDWLLLPPSTSEGTLLYWGAQAHLWGAGLLFQRAEIPPPATRIALLHGTDLESAHRAMVWAEHHDAYTCWQVERGERDPEIYDRVLDVTGPRLAHVRLPEAGPETHGIVGRGVLLDRLVRRDYEGTVALSPLSLSYRQKPGNAGCSYGRDGAHQPSSKRPSQSPW